MQSLNWARILSRRQLLVIVVDGYDKPSTTAMTFPCFVLSKDPSYTFITVYTAEDGATAATVAETAERIVSEYYRGKWNVEIELYKVSLHPPLHSPF